jgi:hypothetical protein
MTTKFACLNPLTGEYKFATSKEELCATVAELAVQLFMQHTHQAPFSIVETLEDGSEKWISPEGEQMLSPAEVRASAELKIKNTQSMQDASALVITRLGV